MMFDFVNKYVIGALLPVVLIFAGVYFIAVLRGVPLRNPIKMIRAMLGRDGDATGISPFRSVTMALAGTLGVGNIVGVASAISMGGFGSVFWMWISALAAMILKYAEIVLAVAYRKKRLSEKGRENHGGAMYYIKACFEKKGKPRTGVILAAVFAFLCIVDSLSMGCVVQVNAVSSSFKGVFGVSPFLCGALLTLLTAIVVTKGIGGISKLTEWLVPIMSLGYIIMSVAVMVICREGLPDAFRLIFSDAFRGNSAASGVFGFLLSDGIRYGTMRGLLSNEAGCGTAPFAHAASNTREPAKQGVWGIFEVFTDTIVLCTMTALVIILNYDKVCAYGADGIMMTVKAYSSVLGKSAEYFLTAAVLLFAYATVICWSHYGKECALYLFPRKKGAGAVFLTIFCGAVFIGSVIAPEEVWTLADFSIGTMTLMNVLVVCLMSVEVREYTRYFLKK